MENNYETYTKFDSEVASKRIHWMRISKGLTVTLFSFVVGLPKYMIEEIESGKYLIGRDVIDHICRRTGKTEEYFFKVD